MKSTLRVEKPDEIQMTMTATMSLREWKELRAELSDRWPASDFKRAIDGLIRQAEAHFYPPEHQA